MTKLRPPLPVSNGNGYYNSLPSGPLRFALALPESSPIGSTNVQPACKPTGMSQGHRPAFGWLSVPLGVAQLFPMSAYFIQIELTPAELGLELGSIVACFESGSEAEDFMITAQRVPSLHGCELTIGESPVQQHMRAQAQAAASPARLGKR